MACSTRATSFVLLCCLLIGLISPRKQVACNEDADKSSSSPDEATTTGATPDANEESVGTTTTAAAAAAAAAVDDPDQLQAEPVEPKKLADNYLQQFGYMDEIQPGEQLKENVFEDSVREFQRYMNITETGKLDELTLATMRKPRCGNKDFDKQEFIDGKREFDSDLVRKKRYKLFGNKWGKKSVTYKVINYPGRRNLNKRTVDMVIDRAFNSWSQVANLDFQKRTGGKVDIELSFGKDKHSCPASSLNRPGRGGEGVLAHAFSPGGEGVAGDVHFNDHYGWSAGSSSSGTGNLQNVAIHELGHSLGLDHSLHDSAIMWPTSNDVTNLHWDDKAGIKSIYGTRDGSRGSNGGNGGGGGGGGHRRPSSCGGRRFLSGPSCEQVYDCRRGRPVLTSCPRNLVWDNRRGYCNFRHNVPHCRW